EHGRERDRGCDAETAPQALRQVALQYRLARMPRIVIDGDGGADRITRKGLRDLEVAEVLAKTDAVVAERLAADGIFVDDIGEVALLEPVSALALAVEHFDVAYLGGRDHHLARRRGPFSRGTHLQRLVGGGEQDEPERCEQHRIDEPRQIRHEISLKRTGRPKSTPPS